MVVVAVAVTVSALVLPSVASKQLEMRSPDLRILLAYLLVRGLQMAMQLTKLLKSTWNLTP